MEGNGKEAARDRKESGKSGREPERNRKETGKKAEKRKGTGKKPERDRANTFRGLAHSHGENMGVMV